MQAELGKTYRDRITGYTGVAMCVSQWLHGCRRITLQSRELKDGKPVDSWTFDELDLEPVGDEVVSAPSSGTGGPRPEPSRH